MTTVNRYCNATPKWGTSSYSNSSSPLCVGKASSYTTRGRLSFDAVSPGWYVTNLSLVLRRTDGYSSRRIRVGASQSADWGASYDAYVDVYISGDVGTKIVDISSLISTIKGYTGTWYLHLTQISTDINSYAEYNNGVSGSAPYISIDYEEATITVPGNEITIGSNNALVAGTSGNGLTHILKYAFGSLSGTINGTAVSGGTTVNWTPAVTFAAQTPTNVLKEGTLTIESYSGGVLSSSISYHVNFRVPNTTTFQPTISSWPLTTDLGGTTYAQNVSKLKSVVSAAGIQGASLVSYALTIDGVTTTSTSSPITSSNKLSTVGALTATLKVTDSRGLYRTVTASITVYAYFVPAITGLKVERATVAQVADVNGTYIKYTLTYKFAALNNTNLRKGTIKHKPDGGSYGATIALDSAMAAKGTGVYESSITGLLGSNDIGIGAYVVSVTIQDAYNTIPMDIMLPNKAIWFDLYPSGNGMAIGKWASVDGLFDVGIKANFDDLTTMKKGFYVHEALGTAGSAGWVKICQLTVTGSYIDCPIEITVSQRTKLVLGRLYIRFTNDSGNDPTLTSFVYTGSISSAYLVKASAGVWDLYVEKTSTYDVIGVVDFKAQYHMRYVTILWTNVHSSTNPGGTLATYDYGDSVQPVAAGGTGKTTVQGILDLLLGIQQGEKSFSLAANAASNIALTFPRAYSATPRIFVSMEGSSNSWTPDAVTVITYAPSATAVTIRVMNANGNARAGKIHWMALGTIA